MTCLEKWRRFLALVVPQRTALAAFEQPALALPYCPRAQREVAVRR